MSGQPPANGRLIALAAAVALLGGVVVAIASTLIPIGFFEVALSSYGVSEIVPAAAPPLGDTARLGIAIVFGLFAAALIYTLFPRKGLSRMASAPKTAPDTDRAKPAAKLTLVDRLKALRFGRAAKPGEVASFDDLPRLRTGDRHPDAPARRPIFANADLGAPLDHDEDDDLVAPPPSVGHRPIARFEAPAEDEQSHTPEMPEPAEPLDLIDPVVAETHEESPEPQTDTVAPPPFAAPPEAAREAIFAAPQAPAEEAEAVEEAEAMEEAEIEDWQDQPAPEPFKAETPAPAAAPFARPVARASRAELDTLSITELVERLERGLARQSGEPESERPATQTVDTDKVAPPPEEPAAAVPTPAPFLRPATERAPDPVPETEAAETEAEAPPAKPVEQDMEDALKAALETLRQMTERQRNAS